MISLVKPTKYATGAKINKKPQDSLPFGWTHLGSLLLTCLLYSCESGRFYSTTERVDSSPNTVSNMITRALSREMRQVVFNFSD